LAALSLFALMFQEMISGSWATVTVNRQAGLAE
jgi:hypothetical protein